MIGPSGIYSQHAFLGTNDASLDCFLVHVVDSGLIVGANNHEVVLACIKVAVRQPVDVEYPVVQFNVLIIYHALELDRFVQA